MKKYVFLWVLLSGVVVNILSFPTVYIHQWQFLIACLLGVFTVGLALFFLKDLTKRSQKIALILGMALNIWPLVWFLFLLITLG
ncbi:MAG: hypothetical protein E6269_02200 [Clostridiales bacterium]|nr:hypothetical protein [Clostridiales bacterium]